MRPALGAAAVMAALVPPLAAIVIKPPPYTVESIKPVLAYVQAHRQSRDQVYLYANAFQAITRYGSHYDMPHTSTR